MFQVYGGEGDNATGEIDKSFATVVKDSTYGRVIAPRNASAAVTVQVGRPWGAPSCKNKDWSVVAMKKLEEQVDFDLEVYDFRIFFLPDWSPKNPDRNGKNMAICKWNGEGEVSCGHVPRLPIRYFGLDQPLGHSMSTTGFPRTKCSSWLGFFLSRQCHNSSGLLIHTHTPTAYTHSLTAYTHSLTAYTHTRARAHTHTLQCSDTRLAGCTQAIGAP